MAIEHYTGAIRAPLFWTFVATMNRDPYYMVCPCELRHGISCSKLIPLVKVAAFRSVGSLAVRPEQAK